MKLDYKAIVPFLAEEILNLNNAMKVNAYM